MPDKKSKKKTYTPPSAFKGPGSYLKQFPALIKQGVKKGVTKIKEKLNMKKGGRVRNQFTEQYD